MVSATAEIGSREDSLNAYTDGLVLDQRLTAAEPGNAWNRLGAARCARQIGVIQRDLDSRDTALDSLIHARDLLEPVAATGDLAALAELGGTLADLGTVYIVTDHLDDVLACFQRALSIREAVHKAEPTGWESRYNLAKSYELLASWHQRVGSVDKEDAAIQAAAGLWLSLSREWPSITALRSSLAANQRRIGIDPRRAEAVGQGEVHNWNRPSCSRKRSHGQIPR